MSITEFLEQGRKLNERIRYKRRKLDELEVASRSTGSGWNTEDRVIVSRREEAPFVRFAEAKEKLQGEIRQLEDLREQIEQMFRDTGRGDYEMVMIYRYLEGMSWGQISEEMMCSVSTAKRWHREAIPLLLLPENPIWLSSRRAGGGEPRDGSR